MSVEPEHLIMDPIHGYIKLYEHEKKIIDTPIFQRLRRIKQLTPSDYVYPGAVHTRFNHSLGVMHVAGEFTQKLLEKVKGVHEEEKHRYYFLMRLWGLTHDIGHGPFSHLFDDVILVPRDLTHEIVGSKIIKEYPQISTIEFPSDITAELISSMIPTGKKWALTGPIRRWKKKSISERALHYVCTGAYSADIIDYLLRDSAFTGVGYGSVDWQRLVTLSRLEGNKVVLDYRAEDAFDSFLLARLFMFSTVYYHRINRAFTKIAECFLKDLNNNGFFDWICSNLDLEEYSKIDEAMLIPKMAKSKYGEMLLAGKNPYSTIYEFPLPKVDREDALRLIDRLDGNLLMSDISSIIRDKGIELPDEAFFIDTPKIRFNPMLHEEKITFKKYDPMLHKEKILKRNVLETKWGNLSVEMGVVRLYIHDEYKKYSRVLKEAFQKPIRKLKTYY